MSTTESENKDLVHRLHNEVWSEGNLDLIDEIVAADFVDHNPAMPDQMQGPADYKETVGMMRTAFPDLTLTEEDTIAEGGNVVSRVTMRGANEGDFLDIPATGKTVEVPGIVINKIEDNQLVESWVQLDMMGLMEQLGVK